MTSFYEMSHQYMSAPSQIYVLRGCLTLRLAGNISHVFMTSVYCSACDDSRRLRIFFSLLKKTTFKFTKVIKKHSLHL